MTARDCAHYKSCSAPLCPMQSDEENEKGIWYPDEEICKRRKHLPEWVKQQRNIAKKINPYNHRFFFTLAMLKVPFRITRLVCGLDPNKKEEPQLKAWFKRNKGTKRRKLTDKQKKQLRLNAAMARAAKAKKQSETV